jgi:hypothetical protein
MLSVFAKQETTKLLRETKHNLTIDDFDDLEKLNELCLDITRDKEINADIIDMPIHVGGYELKQPTIGILEWYNDFYLPLFRDNALMSDAGLAYALTLSDAPDDLWALNDKRQVRKAVKRFLRRLKCSHEDLQAAIMKLLGARDDAPSDNEESTESFAGKMIAMLCREYGHTANYWLWEAPIGIINTFVNDYIGRVEAENDQLRKSSTGANKPPPTDSKIKKFQALRKHTTQMRDKWQKM